MRSPVAYYSDAQFSALPAHERAILFAASQDGVQEVPKGSNWGPVVRAYLKMAGIIGPAFWCAAFVYWCYRMAGVKASKLPRNPAAVASWIDWAKREGRVHSMPQPRGLFYLRHSGGRHIGFVPNATLGFFKTIEGNSNSDGSRNGYEVARNERNLERFRRNLEWGFINMEGLG